MSHLLQMRGLKHKKKYSKRGTTTVASFTDAWIETGCIFGFRRVKFVASFTDAWIETVTENTLLTLPGWSHLLQMRGLKLDRMETIYILTGRIFYRCVD